MIGLHAVVVLGQMILNSVVPIVGVIWLIGWTDLAWWQIVVCVPAYFGLLYIAYMVVLSPIVVVMTAMARRRYGSIE